MQELIRIAITAAVDAGKTILEIYETGDFGVELKADDSPLTLADKAAHKIIEQRLKQTTIPVLSEEGKHAVYQERKQWKQLWIVDPLDGTKEFVKKTGEFTVNIALVEKGYPVLGVVFVPVSGLLYYGTQGVGSFKLQLSDHWRNLNFHISETSKAQKLFAQSTDKELKIVASVSHLSKETEQFAELLKESYGDTSFMSVGSSLKICKVAEGSADIYPRLGPTMEWDTAAGQAVAEYSGASFLNWKTKERFDYNRENLLNDWFVVAGNKISADDLKSLISSFGL
jgi:3'(2'), 5'-bisphosphate nucleotidase